MTQEQFDKDLKGSIDETIGLDRYPEQEEGFADNPIRKIFEEHSNKAYKDNGEGYEL